MAAFQVGSAIGLLVSPVAIQRLGLASPFQIFGALGLVWLLPWLLGTEEHQVMRLAKQRCILYVIIIFYFSEKKKFVLPGGKPVCNSGR